MMNQNESRSINLDEDRIMNQSDARKEELDIRLESAKAEDRSASIRQTSRERTTIKPRIEDTQQTIVSKFLSIHLYGSIETGTFNSVNDVYIKYSIVTGPDWILSSGSEVGITQISRYKKAEDGAQIFVWNQPISISYRSYNYFGWPQIVLSVYYFDTFGNDQILGYGCAYLPISSCTPTNSRQLVKIYAPQSSSLLRQLFSWIIGRKPELVDSNLIARSDCRSVLQMVHTGQIELTFNITSKDVSANGYRS